MSRKRQRRNPYGGEAAHQDRDLPPRDASADSSMALAAIGPDALLTPEQVALRLNVSPDWVRDHSSRKNRKSGDT
jgi:hypothetical protein